MLDEPVVIDEVAVSAAFTHVVPAACNVTLNAPAPSVRVVSAGSVAPLSPLVKCTHPEYPVAVLLYWSRALTFNRNVFPAMGVSGYGGGTSNVSDTAGPPPMVNGAL